MKQRMMRATDDPLRATVDEGLAMNVRSMQARASVALLVLGAGCGLTACSSASDAPEPSTSTASVTASSASPASTAASSVAGTPAPASSETPASSTHSSTTSHGGPTGGVDVTSTTYVAGGYDILVTTRPGASFTLAPASGAPRACTIVQRKPKGILTTHLVHCATERVERASLEVTYAATPKDAPVLVPLVTTAP